MITAIALAAVAAISGPSDLVGRWSCTGRFIPSGRSLASTIDIAPGAVAGSLTVDHLDAAPSRYRSIELWWLEPGTARAAIVDASGMRWLTGTLHNDELTFTRSEGPAPLERFAYRRTREGLDVEWSRRGSRGTLELGDTLACVAAPTKHGRPSVDGM